MPGIIIDATSDVFRGGMASESSDRALITARNKANGIEYLIDGYGSKYFPQFTNLFRYELINLRITTALLQSNSNAVLPLLTHFEDSIEALGQPFLRANLLKAQAGYCALAGRPISQKGVIKNAEDYLQEAKEMHAKTQQSQYWPFGLLFIWLELLHGKSRARFDAVAEQCALYCRQNPHLYQIERFRSICRDWWRAGWGTAPRYMSGGLTSFYRDQRLLQV